MEMDQIMYRVGGGFIQVFTRSFYKLRPQFANIKKNVEDFPDIFP